MGLKSMSFRDYLALPAINHSTLRLFRRSAAHAHEEMLHPKDSTKAQMTGQAIHCAVLEPERFREDYVVAPPVDRRTKAGKAEWDAFEKSHPNAFLLSQEEMDDFEGMARSIYAHPIASQLLGGKGMNEATAVWVDEKTGEECKARMDRYTKFDNYPTAIDLKSTKDASLKEWQRSVHTYAYHGQAAWYLEGLHVLSPIEIPRRFIWIVVETIRPFACVCYEIDTASLEQGQEENRKLLDLYHSCRISGEWPGYDQGLVYSGLPHWAYSNLGDT